MECGLEPLKAKRFAFAAVLVLLAVCCPFARAAGYEDAVKQWRSYEDVAKWMEENFIYVKKNQRMTEGVQTPEETFMLKRGYCKDGATFAIDALNRINPGYDARMLYILSGHYTTLFRMNSKLYIMDLASGPGYASIRGVHGPFDSIKELKEYLKKMGINSSVYIRGLEE